MNKGSVLILAARSDIGMAVAHRFAQDGYDLQLAARQVTTLEDDRLDIQLRYNINVTLCEFDALNTQAHEAFVSSLTVLPIIVVSAIGYMGEQNKSEGDIDSALLVMRSNYEGPASILGVLANQFEKRGSGTLVGISSVAGDRGRASNYVYGSAKAGFTQFLSGLRNRLFLKNVHVITVKPGFVKTKMTADLLLPTFLTGSSEGLASAIYKAVLNNKNILLYKAIWTPIMLIIKAIPESIFKRTKL